MKNYERALEFVETAQEKAKVLANIGNLYFSNNRPQAALGYYKEAASLFEKNPFYLILIARTFLLLKEDERAAKVLATAEEKRKALEKYEEVDDQGTGYYLMAQSYLALGEEEKVLEYLKLALKANPDRFVRRLDDELQDQLSLFYTLKDDPSVTKLLAQYTDKLSPGAWLDLAGRSKPPRDKNRQ